MKDLEVTSQRYEHVHAIALKSRIFNRRQILNVTSSGNSSSIVKSMRSIDPSTRTIGNINYVMQRTCKQQPKMQVPKKCSCRTSFDFRECSKCSFSTARACSHCCLHYRHVANEYGYPSAFSNNASGVNVNLNFYGLLRRILHITKVIINEQKQSNTQKFRCYTQLYSTLSSSFFVFFPFFVVVVLLSPDLFWVESDT